MTNIALVQTFSFGDHRVRVYKDNSQKDAYLFRLYRVRADKHLFQIERRRPQPIVKLLTLFGHYKAAKRDLLGR